MKVRGKASPRRPRVAEKACLARPRKVPLPTRRVPRLPPARPATLPRPGCPPPAPAWLRTSLQGASGPRCRRRDTARRFAALRASHRCSSRSHGAGESARPSGRVLGAPLPSPVSGDPSRRPYRQDGASRPEVSRRALRIRESGAPAPTIPPNDPAHPAPPACAPAVFARRPAKIRAGALPRTPPTSALDPRGEQLLRASLGCSAGVWPLLGSDGIPAEFLLYRKA